MDTSEKNYLYEATPEELGAIRTTPGKTSSGKPFDHYVRRKVEEGDLRLECLRPDVLGLERPLEVYRADRKGNFIVPWDRTEDESSYCPAHWADLRIGRGACGLRCRACFLVMTHRLFCDPSRHLLYENTGDFERAVKKWLKDPDRKNLGLGIDCSDSLLYEGVVGHARRLIPHFASVHANPHGCKFILLTKSANVHYLEGLPSDNVLLTFSLNPEKIADLWEGKFDDGTRVTPSVDRRLNASLRGEQMGFEVRWRVDPIFPVPQWKQTYQRFFEKAAKDGHRPTRITLGTYREMQPTLLTFSRKWGLPPLEVDRPDLQKDGDHYHLKSEQRAEIYTFLRKTIVESWREFAPPPTVALCKEPRWLRKRVGLDHGHCNCE
mgnify:CR=1 FL=1